MTNERFFKRLDSLADWTGVPALAAQPPRRGPMRWPSTVALVLAFGGYGVSLAHQMQTSAAMIGYGLEILGFIIGLFVQVLGPLKPWGSVLETADEWDRAIRARAYLVTFAVFAITTLVGLIVLIAAIALEWPKPALTQIGSQTLFLLFTIINAMPVAHAS